MQPRPVRRRRVGSPADAYDGVERDFPIGPNDGGSHRHLLRDASVALSQRHVAGVGGIRWRHATRIDHSDLPAHACVRSDGRAARLLGGNVRWRRRMAALPLRKSIQQNALPSHISDRRIRRVTVVRFRPSHSVYRRRPSEARSSAAVGAPTLDRPLQKSRAVRDALNRCTEIGAFGGAGRSDEYVTEPGRGQERDVSRLIRRGPRGHRRRTQATRPSGTRA